MRGATASIIVTRGRSGRGDETEISNLGKTNKYKHKQNILLNERKFFMAINYTFYEGGSYKYIKTRVENIKPVIINNRLLATSYYGINGGFFSWGTGKPGDANFVPPSPLGISWYPGAQTDGKDYSEYNTADDFTHTSRGTFCVYYNNSAGRYESVVYQNSSAASLKSVFQSYGQNPNAFIGGGSLRLLDTQAVFDNVYNSEKWNLNSDLKDNGLVHRTGLGFKVENNVWYAYLIISGNRSLYDLRNLMLTLGCYDGIFLDGSGSTQMQCAEYTDNGTDNGRILSTAITLINKT